MFVLVEFRVKGPYNRGENSLFYFIKKSLFRGRRREIKEIPTDVGQPSERVQIYQNPLLHVKKKIYFFLLILSGVSVNLRLKKLRNLLLFLII